MSTREAVHAVALSQLGHVEAKTKAHPNGNVVPYWDWWKAETGENWQGESYCAAGASWSHVTAGHDLDFDPKPGFIYCPAGEAHYRAEGRLVGVERGELMDFVFFHFVGEANLANHVGLWESINRAARTVTCIEFNTLAPGANGKQSNGGGCYRRTRPWSAVRGVGQPTYIPAPAAPPAPQPVEDLVALSCIVPWQPAITAGPLKGRLPMLEVVPDDHDQGAATLISYNDAKMSPPFDPKNPSDVVLPAAYGGFFTRRLTGLTGRPTSLEPVGSTIVLGCHGGGTYAVARNG